jgi:hypothetical protein
MKLPPNNNKHIPIHSLLFRESQYSQQITGLVNYIYCIIYLFYTVRNHNIKYVNVRHNKTNTILTSLSVNGLSDDRTKSIKSARGTYSSVSCCCLWRITFVPGVSTRFICSVVHTETSYKKGQDVNKLRLLSWPCYLGSHATYKLQQKYGGTWLSLFWHLLLNITKQWTTAKQLGC